MNGPKTCKMQGITGFSRNGISRHTTGEYRKRQEIKKRKLIKHLKIVKAVLNKHDRAVIQNDRSVKGGFGHV